MVSMEEMKKICVILFALVLSIGGFLFFREDLFEFRKIECLEPTFSFSYRTIDLFNFYSPETWPEVRLSSVVEPQLPDENDALVSLTNLVVDNRGDVWIKNIEHQIFRFTPDQDKLRVYELYLPGETDSKTLWPGLLFLSQNGDVWIRASLGFDDIRIFYYDSSLDEFRYVPDMDGVFLKGSARSSVVVDQTGLFWMTNEFGQLIKFNPYTQKAEVVLDQEDGYLIENQFSSSSLALSPEGTFWMEADRLNPDGSTYPIFAIEYDPHSGEITEYDVHAYVDSGVGPGTSVLRLVFDNYNRIWISSERYLQIENDGSMTWYALVDSPVFYSNRKDFIANGYTTGFPNFISADRFLWFTSSAGVIRLDLAEEEWCLVASLRNPVIFEDTDQNIWFAGEGQIYKIEAD
jgi:hypothetical protein